MIVLSNVKLVKIMLMNVYHAKDLIDKEWLNSVNAKMDFSIMVLKIASYVILTVKHVLILLLNAQVLNYLILIYK